MNYLDTHKSIIISAPAGSGKTEKLARRYIALLQNGVDAERILAITFTEKASAEMKQRILKILREEDNGLFIKLMERMPLMRVSTIHSFCGTLLRRFSFETAIDPNYRIEDAVDSRMTWEDILYEILMDAGRGDRGHELFYQTLAEKGFRGLDYLRGTVDYLYGKSPFSLEASVFNEVPQTPDAVREELLSWQGAGEAVEGYEDFLKHGTCEHQAAMEKSFLTEKKEPRKRPAPLLRHIIDYRDWAIKMHLVWKDWKIREHVRRSGRIGEIFRQCLDMYRDKKRAAGALDFSDLEYLAYRMLTEDPEWASILYAFDEKTDHILVDEFQDTNTFQWGIINKLTEEWRSGMGAKREAGGRPTVFFVGDEKQSIYYFRGANVEIFSRAREKLQEWLGEEFCYGEVTDNYRSLPAIIEFTNHVFSRIMITGEKPFPWSTTYTTFHARRKSVHGSGCVEVILTDDEEDTTAGAKQKEAEVLALRIRELAGSYLIEDRHTQSQRPCRYMDMAVLLRKRTHLKKYEEAFKKYRIPFVAVKGIGFYQEPEVAMLRALVFFLSDPADDYSLYVLLKSPLFQVRESDIIGLTDSEGDSLFSKLQQQYPAGNGTGPRPDLFPSDTPGPGGRGPAEADPGKLRQAAVRLQEWLALLPYASVAELIEETLVSTAAWRHFHDEQCKANIRKFIRIVEDLETGGKSLIRIRDFLERTFDRTDEPKANVNTEGMDAVRIMTIHAAKGLEFPLVFVPGLEEPFGTHSSENLVYEKGGRFFFKSVPESSIRRQDEDFQIHQAREEEEQKRLFYVAVTRAGEALFLLGRWSSRDNSFLAFLKQGIGLEKTGTEYSFADIPGLSVLSEDDLKTLFKKPAGHISGERTAPRVSLTPLTVRRQAPWKAVTETVEIKRQHGKDWTVIGDIMHRLFEGISKGTLCEQDIRVRAEKMLESGGFYREEKTEKIELIERDINALREKGIWHDIVLPAKDSFAELPFILEAEGTIYTGRIDRIVKVNDTYNIYDYKTFPVREREMEYLLKKYSVQLNIYKKAVRKLFHTEDVRSFVVFTHTGDVKEV